MVFTNPLYLWTLLGMLVPLAIHLWSKKEGKTIKVGSIEFLKESDSKQSSSIKLNELLLLFLRLLIIALVALILAGAQIKRKAHQSELTYIVEPELFKDERFGHLLDTLKTSSTLLLQNGLPNFDEDLLENEPQKQLNYWQLAQQMESLKTDSIIVFTLGLTKALYGKRPQVDANIDWVILENENAKEQALRLYRKEDSFELLSVKTNTKHLNFTKRSVSKNSKLLAFNAEKDSVLITTNKTSSLLKIEDEKPLNVFIYYSDLLGRERRQIEASIKAISKHLNKVIHVISGSEVENLSYSNSDVIIWLSSKDVQTEKPVLIYKPDELASSLIVPSLEKNRFYLTKHLNTEQSVLEHLPEQLLKFFSFNKGLHKTIENYDNRIVNREALETQKVRAKVAKKGVSVFSLSKWLWITLILSFTLERVIAYYRKQ